MAIKFQTKAGAPNPATSGASTKDLQALTALAHKMLCLPPTAGLSLGMTRSTITTPELSVVLNFGIPHVKNAGAVLHPRMDAARKALTGLSYMEGSSLPAFTPGESTGGAAQLLVPLDMMNDEQWVEHVASQLFPGIVHLHTAEELYQPVQGTGTGSVYKTCFIGPELKVAARIVAASVSFRATTSMNTCPEGQLANVFQRLGVVQSYPDRMTCHATMSGAFGEHTAHEYRALFGAFYAALKPWVSSNFPNIKKLTEGVK